MPAITQQLALNLGCGNRHKASTEQIQWLNIDQRPPADLVGYLEDLLPTFQDGSVSQIEADNVVEHLDHDTFMAVMNECHRILTTDGTLRLIVPDTLRWPDGSFGDPTHRRFFVDRSFEYWTETPLWHHYGSAYGFKCWHQQLLRTDGQFFEWIGRPLP